MYCLILNFSTVYEVIRPFTILKYLQFEAVITQEAAPHWNSSYCKQANQGTDPIQRM